MTDQLLLVSRIAFLALVYLVFLRVARAVVVEIRAETRVSTGTAVPTMAPANVASAAGMHNPASPPAGAVDLLPLGRLTVVSPGSLSGTPFALSPETTIGRASGCGVLIEDALISKLHARIFRNGPQWMIEDLGSTNGTELNGNPLTSPCALDRGDRIRVGEVVMELS